MHPPRRHPDLLSSRTNRSNVWTQEDSGVTCTPWLSFDGPHWNRVVRRVTRVADTGKVLSDQHFASGVLQKHAIHAVPSPDQHVASEFYYKGPAMSLSPDMKTVSMPIWRPMIQANVCKEVCAGEASGKKGKIRLMEVFSPPRFAPIVQSQGHEARCYDLKTGFDLSKSVDRKRVEQDLLENRPDLLILCPPCTHEGGWFHLNSSKFDHWECLRLRAQSRWCAKLSVCKLL